LLQAKTAQGNVLIKIITHPASLENISAMYSLCKHHSFSFCLQGRAPSLVDRRMETVKSLWIRASAK
jgi:hypothetical protein